MPQAPQRVDDEGTYVAQDWAMQRWRTLGHYTYWYHHPPLGWLLLAAWTTLTGAFNRAATAVAAGRRRLARSWSSPAWQWQPWSWSPSGGSATATS